MLDAKNNHRFERIYQKRVAWQDNNNSNNKNLRREILIWITRSPICQLVNALSNSNRLEKHRWHFRLSRRCIYMNCCCCFSKPKSYYLEYFLVFYFYVNVCVFLCWLLFLCKHRSNADDGTEKDKEFLCIVILKFVNQVKNR